MMFNGVQLLRWGQGPAVRGQPGADVALTAGGLAYKIDCVSQYISIKGPDLLVLGMDYALFVPLYRLHIPLD
jgi:hypothetical protein